MWPCMYCLSRGPCRRVNRGQWLSVRDALRCVKPLILTLGRKLLISPTLQLLTAKHLISLALLKKRSCFFHTRRDVKVTGLIWTHVYFSPYSQGLKSWGNALDPAERPLRYHFYRLLSIIYWYTLELKPTFMHELYHIVIYIYVYFVLLHITV